MKRIILLCLVVLVVSFSAGCSDDNSVEPVSSDSASLDKTLRTVRTEIFEDEPISLWELGASALYIDYYGFKTKYAYDALYITFDFTISDPSSITFYIRSQEVDARSLGNDRWIIEDYEFEYNQTYDVMVRIYYPDGHTENTCGTWSCEAWHG